MARQVRRLLALLLTMGATACCTPKIPAPDWKEVGPVVDIHCHIFDGRDLPIADWLVAVGGVPRDLAAFLELLVDANSKNPPPRHGAKIAADVELASLAGKLRLSVKDWSRPSEDEIDAVVALFESQARQSRLKLEQAVSAKGPRVSVSTVNVRNLIRWIVGLTRGREELAQTLATAFPHTALFTPSIVDMNYWFGKGPDGSVPWSIEEQIHSMEEVVEKGNGRFLAMIAFDPEREWRRRRQTPAPKESLKELLERATAKGFVGVKLYPPFGYRATNNVELGKNGHDCGVPILPQHRPDYDRVLLDLFDACVELDLPIQAHCEDPGAGIASCGEHADPRHWAALLGSNEAKWQALRLDLMHFGGVDGLVDQDYKKSWAATIASLMQRFPRLYADVGAHEIPIPSQQELRRRFYGRLDELGTAVRDRLMFGTDWHLIVRHDDWESFESVYLETWRERFGIDSARRFARGAALEYLGIVGGGKNAQRVRALFAKQGWHWPPEWL